MAKVPPQDEVRFPSKLVAPVGEFLKDQLNKLEKNKQKIEESDPFASEGRVDDNAAVDTEAEEQFGHAMSTAMKDQIDKKIIQTRKALARIKIGKYGLCEVCGRMIDTDRLMIYPEATRCMEHAKTKRRS